MRLNNGRDREIRNRYIGIDGGGTKTACLIGDDQGNVLAHCLGGASNMKSLPWEEVQRAIAKLIRETLELSDTSASQLGGIFLGLAGSDRQEDRKRIKAWLREEWPEEIKITVHNDAVTALAAGTWGRRGLVLISGTGSIAYGYDPDTGEFVRAGGWGYLLGDEGSGFDLGRKALAAVMRAHDGRGEPTILTRLVLERWGLDQPEQLINTIYGQDNVRAAIADGSKLVVKASSAGDAVAGALVDEAICELALLVKAASERMSGSPEISSDPSQRTEEEVSLVLTGGLFGDQAFERKFREALAAQAGGYGIHLLDRPPVVGSYLLALRESGISLTESIKQNIERWIKSIQQ